MMAGTEQENDIRTRAEAMTGPPPKPVEKAATQGAVGPQAESVGINLGPGSHDDGWLDPPPVALSDGTAVQLFKDGAALLAAYRAIELARRRICLEVYIFSSDDTGRAFADLLCRKARQGVKVFVIYDSFGSIDSDPAMFRQLRHAGVRTTEFHPMRPWDCRFGWRPFNRDHRKLLIIDDDIAGLGGLNIGGEYGGSWVIKSSKRRACDFWRDNAIGIVGPGAQLFFQSFARTWKYAQRGGRIRGAEFIHALHDGELAVLGTVATLTSPLLPFLRYLLQQARSSVLPTRAYFAPDDPLIDALCHAAARGVRVRLMLPGRCDVQLLHLAACSFYETLLASGVEIYERQGVVLHTKALVVDEQTTIIGSTNLDYRSIEYNCELSAVIRNAELGRQMCGLFENDVRYAKQIRLSEWRHRPWLDRFGQWAVSRARYLL
jgi:cardiolipin synthase